MVAPLGRIITAMVTPFAADGELDLDVARSLARHLVAHGSEGLVLAGTTGEGPTVTDDERIRLVEAVVDEVGDRASVIATTGTYDTRHSVHLTREARAAGADAFLVVTPYYSKPPAEGVYRHFRVYADEGISRIIIGATNRFDDLQYGYSIPEPGSAALVLAGAAFARRRRRTA